MTKSRKTENFSSFLFYLPVRRFKVSPDLSSATFQTLHTVMAHYMAYSHDYLKQNYN